VRPRGGQGSSRGSVQDSFLWLEKQRQQVGWSGGFACLMQERVRVRLPVRQPLCLTGQATDVLPCLQASLDCGALRRSARQGMF